MANVLKDIAAILTAPAFLVAVSALIHSINTRKGKGTSGNGANPSGKA